MFARPLLGLFTNEPQVIEAALLRVKLLLYAETVNATFIIIGYIRTRNRML